MKGKSFTEQLDKYVKDIAEKYHQAVEELTLEQFEDLIVGMIKSGDIVRHFQNHPSGARQGLSYLPYNLKHKLEKENQNLKDALKLIAFQHTTDNDTTCYEAASHNSEIAGHLLGYTLDELTQCGKDWDIEDTLARYSWENLGKCIYFKDQYGEELP